MGTVADAWEFLTTWDEWTGPRGILARTRAHLWVSIVAMAIAAAIAVPSAVGLAHRRTAPGLSVAVVNIGRAIPSFAIIALVLPLSIQYGFGLGFWPTCVALVALAIPPMFTNTYVGIASTPAATVEAARGVGMTGGQVLRRVEWPTALPLVLAGVRISAVQVVATAALGAIVGYECLGTYIVAGLSRGSAARDEVLAGALLVAALALAVDALLGRTEPLLAPWKKRLR
jgi:osmoprotectant transport system permease protein